VLSRETGQVVRTFVAEAFFYLHIINQFESRDGEYIALDICCYRNPKMLELMFIDSMKVTGSLTRERGIYIAPIIFSGYSRASIYRLQNMHKNADFARLFRARPLRFILPMKQSCPDTPMEYDFIATSKLSPRDTVDNEAVHREMDFEITDDSSIKHSNIKLMIDGFEQASDSENRYESVLRKKPVAQRLPDGRIFVKPELLCDVGCETPRINVDSCLGREYRYFYAISCDMDMDNPGTVRIS